MLQNKIAQEQLQHTRELETAKLQLEDTKSLREDATKRYVAELAHNMNSEETTDDGVEDPLEVEKFKLDTEKVKNSHLEKMIALNQDMIKHQDDVELKKESNQISRIKKKSTT